MDLQGWLEEDIGSGDITSNSLMENQEGSASIYAKESCVLAGLDVCIDVFKELNCIVTCEFANGDRATIGEVIISVKGRIKDILAGERLALNLLGRLSGIATLTRALVDAVTLLNPNVQVAATRKTTPGLRGLEKAAVAAGGGHPHRQGLYDAILIKENHIAVVGSMAEAIKRAKASGNGPVEVEVEDREQAMEAADIGANTIMLDNFTPEEAAITAAAVRRIDPTVRLEISGGITPDNIAEYACVADMISLGWLTHSVRSIDFSMLMDVFGQD